MCDWVEQAADLLRPITNAMAAATLAAHRVHTDDTGIPILSSGRTQKGHVWVYVADDDLVTFRFTSRRKSDGPREFLRGYTGYVQADAANLYDRLFGDGEGDEEGPRERRRSAANVAS
jgi:transposase